MQSPQSPFKDQIIVMRHHTKPKVFRAGEYSPPCDVTVMLVYCWRRGVNISSLHLAHGVHDDSIISCSVSRTHLSRSPWQPRRRQVPQAAGLYIGAAASRGRLAEHTRAVLEPEHAGVARPNICPLISTHHPINRRRDKLQPFDAQHFKRPQTRGLVPWVRCAAGTRLGLSPRPLRSFFSFFFFFF